MSFKLSSLPFDIIQRYWRKQLERLRGQQMKNSASYKMSTIASHPFSQVITEFGIRIFWLLLWGEMKSIIVICAWCIIKRGKEKGEHWK